MQQWPQLQNLLRRRLGDDLYAGHFQTLGVKQFGAGRLELATADEMAALVIDKNYREVVVRSVAEVMGEPIDVRITYIENFVPPSAPEPQISLFEWASNATPAADIRHARPAETHAERATEQRSVRTAAASGAHAAARTAPGTPAISGLSSFELTAAEPAKKPTNTDIWRQSVMRCGLSESLGFERFVVGSSNQFAYEYSVATSEAPGQLHNPLFIYGGVGLGKTHLMNAIGLEVLRRNPSARVRYLSAETFVNDLIESIGAHRMDEFRQRNRNDVDVLLIDDIQFIVGKERTQEEFFHTFNALSQRGKQIVISSDRVPAELSKLEERLVSRLAQGLMVDVQAPDFETRTAILRQRAADAGFDVELEVLDYIARRVQSNVRELFGTLTRIGALARHRKVRITLEFARSQLEEVHRERNSRASTERIIELTAQAFSVSPRDIKGRKRVAAIALPRKVAMYLARNLTNHSFPELGEQFGKRDHTTVLSAVQSVEELVKSGDPVRSRIEQIERKVRAEGIATAA